MNTTGHDVEVYDQEGNRVPVLSAYRTVGGGLIVKVGPVDMRDEFLSQAEVKARATQGWLGRW